MRSADLLRYAATQMGRNKGRSALTAIGVTVGVFSFTTIVAIGRGLEATVIDQLTDDESQTRIVLRPGFGSMPEEVPQTIEGVTDPAKADRIKKSISKRRRGGPGQMRRTLLTPEALAKLRAQPHVTGVRPYAIDRFAMRLDEQHSQEATLSFGLTDDPRWQARVVLGQPLANAARGVWLHEYTLYRWGFRSDAEQAAVLGRDLVLTRPREAGGVAALMDAARRSGLDVPNLDPSAAEPLLKAYAARLGLPGGAGPKGPDLAVTLPILGVVRERVDTDGFSVWEDSFSMQADLFLPQELAEALFLEIPSNVANGFNAAAVDVDAIGNVAPVEQRLKDEGYGTASVGTILERVGQSLALITVFVGGLTAIALFVAVLGIVNTMIMNVSERTREIGVLKALGATDGQVRGLFVVESALIGALGGALGISLALLGSVPGDAIASYAAQRMTEYALPGSIFRFPPWLVASGLGLAVLLSVLAALGPARAASRIDPVVALRDE